LLLAQIATSDWMIIGDGLNPLRDLSLTAGVPGLRGAASALPLLRRFEIFTQQALLWGIGTRGDEGN
jgi:hypothetical protein